METYLKSTNTKRFVVEDSITKVTSDGEPHEMMTMVAGLSGLLAAIVILAILISLVGCKKNRSRSTQCKNCPSSIHSTESIDKLPCGAPVTADSTRSSLTTIYTRATSLAEGTDDDLRPRLSSVSVISNGNLGGNLNSAFVGSELRLSDSFSKQKKTQWSDGTAGPVVAKETAIDIERY